MRKGFASVLILGGVAIVLASTVVIGIVVNGFNNDKKLSSSYVKDTNKIYKQQNNVSTETLTPPTNKSPAETNIDLTNCDSVEKLPYGIHKGVFYGGSTIDEDDVGFLDISGTLVNRKITIPSSDPLLDSYSLDLVYIMLDKSNQGSSFYEHYKQEISAGFSLARLENGLLLLLIGSYDENKVFTTKVQAPKNFGDFVENNINKNIAHKYRIIIATFPGNDALNYFACKVIII